jgi:hypothetical protein
LKDHVINAVAGCISAKMTIRIQLRSAWKFTNAALRR